MFKDKNIILVIVIILIVCAVLIIEREKVNKINPANVNLSSGLAPEISDPTGFINADSSLKIHDFIGKKVVLVDFWTYSCINCQRTLPYLKAWWAKYKDQGLEIIGIHTPEFDFEKDYSNVSNFVKQNGITYPVVMDNNYGTWNAYGNQYWPAEYLIDKTGKIVDSHFGEGDYSTTEAKIQDLLGITAQISKPDAVTPTNSDLLSPETYFGSTRNEFLANGVAGQNGIQSLVLPTGTDISRLYLGGKWNFSDQFAETNDDNEKILYRFDAKNVYFVAGANNPTKIRVLIDGRQTQELTVKDQTLYQIYAGQDFGEHALEIDVLGLGLQAYTFTFG